MLSALLPLALAACGDDQEAQFGPEQPVPQQRPVALGKSQSERFLLQDMGAGRGGEGSAAGFSADTPAGWQPAATSQFRQLNWRIGDEGQCYLTVGVGGGLVGNANRWIRDQFGQPAIGQAEFDRLPRHPLMGGPAALVEVEGTFSGGMGGGGKADGYKLLGLLGGTDTDVVTLKLTGPKALVDQHRDAFLAVAKSIRRGGASASGAPPAPGGGNGARPEPPPNHAQGGAQPPPTPGHGAEGAGASPFTAEVPAGWKPIGDTGSRLFRHGFGTGGEVYVGQLGGGLSAMLGIWYGEVNQTPPDEAAIAALPEIELMGQPAKFLELDGEFRGMGGPPIPDARLLVAVRSDGNGVVFAKCVGPKDEVAAQKDAFVTWCKTLRRAQ